MWLKLLAGLVGGLLVGMLCAVLLGLVLADPAAAGAALGGGFMAVLTGVVGFFLGAVFLITGLLIGREREVVVIREGERTGR